jgi:hypothetical protein
MIIWLPWTFGMHYLIGEQHGIEFGRLRGVGAVVIEQS